VLEDLWYKNAVIYCLDVETYLDGNGDGIGDFAGLTTRLDYLAGLGVTCVWLQPFYPSPNKDNGYDVADYYGVDSRHGTLGDFVEFMNHAQQLGMRVVVDLVLSHSSNRHPWFQSARRDPQSPYRDWYVWTKKRPKDHASGLVFPGVQKTNWTYDPVARQYFFHRFYEFQPDLDAHHPAFREEIRKIMGFWLQLGISGFRMDAVPFLIERKGAGVDPVKDYELLHEMRDFLQWRVRDAILLAEANVPPEENMLYFGEEGEQLQMMLNFPVNQRLFYALATSDLKPLVKALHDTKPRPRAAQWVHFLRSHDELDLGRLTDAQRERTFAALAPEAHMQLYDRGIRRRLAPMLDNDRRRLELAYSTMLTLPGTPMLQYGDEIGMGDDLSLPERNCARTPMQWSAERHAGFSHASRIVRRVVSDPIYGYQRVNVATQRRDPDSFLSWMERALRTRRECPEIPWGDWRVVETDAKDVLVMRYDWRGESLVMLHNFGRKPRAVRLGPNDVPPKPLISLLTTEQHDSTPDEQGRHVIELEAYGYRWFRAGGLDGLPQR
jgi:maltose alpha-D-glucosyltransferase / alpha-amylase